MSWRFSTYFMNNSHSHFVRCKVTNNQCNQIAKFSHIIIHFSQS